MGKDATEIPRWTVEEATGYRPITTLWADFSIAEQEGGRAIFDAYNKAFAECRRDYKRLTELVMVLNHKCWAHYKPGRSLKENALSILYTKLFSKADDYACTHLKGEELSYFISTTD